MSRRNREKRAAKQKNRRQGPSEQERMRFEPGPDQVLRQELLVAALRHAAMCPNDDAELHATELLDDQFPALAQDLDLAADTAIVDAIQAAWEGGWLPSDLHELARTRSFRQSFHVAYATRIGERLGTTNATVTAEMADRRLLPVLAARSQAADELTNRLFPSMRHRPVSVSNRAGWGAGRAAADLALLDVHASIAG
jgi:hypothetical protein